MKVGGVRWNAAKITHAVRVRRAIYIYVYVYSRCYEFCRRSFIRRTIAGYINVVVRSFCSMLCIQEELGQLSGIAVGPAVSCSARDSQIAQIARVASARSESESNTNSSDSATKCGGPVSGTLDTQKTSWLEGVLGCMRPVFALLSKAGGNEKIKGNQGRLLFFLFNKNVAQYYFR